MKNFNQHREDVCGRTVWTLVGMYKIEETVFTNSGETASWYWKVKVPAGIYPVYVHHHQPNVYYVHDLDGVCVESHVVNRIGANTSIQKDKDVGHQMSASLSNYDYIMRSDKKFIEFN